MGFDQFEIEEDIDVLDASRVQFAPFGIENRQIYEDVGKQRRLVGSFDDTTGKSSLMKNFN